MSDTSKTSAAPYVPNYHATPAELAAFAKERTRIPDEVYPTVQYWSQTATSDCVPVRFNPETRKREFLVSRRTQRPWKDQYFMIGGRILPGETSQSNLVKILEKRELGIRVSPESLLFVGEFSCWNPESQTESNQGWWSLQRVYTFEIKDAGLKFTSGDGLTGDFRWFHEIPADFPFEFKRILTAPGLAFEEAL